MFSFKILAQEIHSIPVAEGMSTSQIAIIIACLVYVIRELVQFINKLLDDRKKTQNQNQYFGDSDRRKQDTSSIVAHQMMMDQHERMIKGLENQAAVLSNISGEMDQIKEITKSTSGKATDIRLNVIQIKSDVKSIDSSVDVIEGDTKLILDRLPRSS